MKRIMMLVLSVMLIAGFCFAQVKIEKDKADMFDCPDSKAYISACEEAQQLKASGNYEEAAAVTPFSWCAAWYLYNAAGKVMSDKSEAGEWNFCNPEVTTEAKAKANELLKAARIYREVAQQSDFNFPMKGKNSVGAFDYAMENADKALNGTRCKDSVEDLNEKDGVAVATDK